jgi:UDP-N-acetylmuramyl-tripeptide synthetase
LIEQWNNRIAVHKRLTDILQGINYTANQDISGILIQAVTTDSRKVAAGSLFVCVQGSVADGHTFMAAAAAQGAVAIVANRKRCAAMNSQALPIILVDDTRQAIGDLASAFYDHPSVGMTMIGLTGTNGKTTTSYILEAIIQAAGSMAGVIGTINYRYGGQEFPARFTTPEPVELQCLLREMADHGVTHVVMEVSSHALAMQRIRGISFDSALFTNLTRDHLDFHVDMETYYQAKKLLFSEYLSDDGSAVILVDTDGEPTTQWGWRLGTELKGHERGQQRTILTCGIETDCDISAKDCAFSVDQTTATITARGQQFQIDSNLVGAFNLKNILGATGVAIGLGFKQALIAQALATPLHVPGRLETVSVADHPGQPAVFVDYAHTPDALQNVLVTLRQLDPARIIVVFGCGGDRDPGKRQIMGAIAGRLADVAIITADNSRSESTAMIMTQIEQGLLTTAKTIIDPRKTAPSGYAVISNRSEAIALALELAEPQDIVLISGKGHENYQISATGTIFFDDRLEAAKCLQARSRPEIAECSRAEALRR